MFFNEYWLESCRAPSCRQLTCEIPFPGFKFCGMLRTSVGPSRQSQVSVVLVPLVRSLAPMEVKVGKKLYVGNLPFSTDDATLGGIFAEVGTVESSKVIFDRETGRSKGFGFVEMASDNEAAAAIERFNGAEFQGRSLTVSEARPPSPRDDRGPRGGGGFGGGGGGGRGGYGGGGGRGGNRY